MSAERERGVVLAKPPTGPSQPAKFHRSVFTKSRPIPKKELYNRLVRTNQPTRKSVHGPAHRSSLHPQRVEKSFAGLKEVKKEQRDIRAAAKWDDIYNLHRPNVYQDYKGSDEQRKEKTEWKARLYAHPAAQGRDGRRLDGRRQDSARSGDRKGR